MSKALPLLLILSLSALICLPLLAGDPGFLMYPSDGPIHLLWAEQFSSSLSSGILYPRWSPDLNAGSGSPSFVFYPPLTFYVYSFFDFFVNDIPRAMSLGLFLGMLLSGFFMYLLGLKLFSKASALIASFGYMLMSYHVIDLLYRSALAEFWAFVWLPLIVYFLVGIKDNPQRGSLGLGLSYALLVLTHLPTAFIFTFIIIAYCLYDYLAERSIDRLRYAMGGLALGLGLSAVYLLPVVFERRWVDIAYLVRANYYDISNNFLFSKTSTDPGLIKLLSIAGTISVVPSLIYIVAFYKDQTRSIFSFFAYASALSFVLTLGISLPLWRYLPGLKTIQFSFRLLSVVSFSSALIAGRMINEITRKHVVYTTAFVLLANTIVSIWVIDQYYSFFSESELSQARQSVIRRNLKYDDLKAGFKPFHKMNPLLADVQEYRPVWSVREDGASITPDESLPIAVMLSGSGKIQQATKAPQETTVNLTAETAGTLLIKTLYYPGWSAAINGRDADIAPHSETGLITVGFDSGVNDIKVAYKGTPYQRTGKIISMLSLIASISIYFFPKNSS